MTRGFGQLGCYGSPIATPNLDTLAAGGLLYTSMHTTALCSPSRSCIITGCNHHANATAAGAHSPARIGYFRRAPRRRSHHYRWRANRQRLAQLTIRISSTDQVNPVLYNLRARHNRRGERKTITDNLWLVFVPNYTQRTSADSAISDVSPAAVIVSSPAGRDVL